MAEATPSFLSLLGLPETTVEAIFKTRVRICYGEELPLELDTLWTTVARGTTSYKCGVCLERDDDDESFDVRTYTVAHGRHVLNTECDFSSDGTFLRGSINCLGAGFITMDQEYYDELIGELIEKNPEWDEIR